MGDRLPSTAVLMLLLKTRRLQRIWRIEMVQESDEDYPESARFEFEKFLIEDVPPVFNSESFPSKNNSTKE